MSKKRLPVSISIKNYGLYAKWSNSCSEFPKFLKFTKVIPARIEAEFGFIINVKGGKGQKLSYRIVHPVFIDDNNGEFAGDFVGDIPIRTNDWSAYIGDTLWDPVGDKIGDWRVIAELNGEIVADMVFKIVSDSTLYSDIIDEHKSDHIK